MEEVAYADQMSGLTQQDATLLSSQQIESKTTTIHEDLLLLWKFNHEFGSVFMQSHKKSDCNTIHAHTLICSEERSHVD